MSVVQQRESIYKWWCDCLELVHKDMDFEGSAHIKTYANNYTTCSSVALPDTFNLELLSLRLIIIIAMAYL